MVTRFEVPPGYTLVRTDSLVANRPGTPLPKRPPLVHRDSRDSEIMAEIERQLYPEGRTFDNRTWVDNFVEKGWPKIKAGWAKFKARLRARGPAA